MSVSCLFVLVVDFQRFLLIINYEILINRDIDSKTICLDPLICASYSGIIADHINCLNFALKTFQTSTTNQMTETNDQVIRRSQLEILKRNSLAETKYGSTSG